SYIEALVRALLVGSAAFALSDWVLARRRRRLVDEGVLAVHSASAVALLAAAAIWIAAGFKLAWGTAARVPPALPSLVYLLFVPAAVVGVAYLAAALRRVHGGAWWVAVLRALVASVVALAAVTATTIVLASRAARG